MKKPKRVDYSPEFKMEAVRLVKARKKPVSQLAAELGVARQLLHSWVRAADRSPSPSCGEIFPGHGKRSGAAAEIARLRKELAQAKEDNEILKKAAAFFAKNHR